jgi:hypothetical protein
MVKSFHRKDAQALFEGKCPRRFKAIAVVAERKLQMLDDALALIDLRLCAEAAKASGVFASMTNGDCAFASRMAMPLMWRSSITTEETEP